MKDQLKSKKTINQKQFIKKIKDVGVNSVKISPCVVDNDGTVNNEYHQSIFNNVKQQVTRAIGDFASKDFEVSDSYHEMDDKFKKEYNYECSANFSLVEALLSNPELKINNPKSCNCFL